MAVLNIDLDGFKALNDAFGHAAGTACCARPSGRQNFAKATCWPRSGDEFFAVLNDCDEGRAQAVAARIIAVIPGNVSACIGLVIAPGRTEVQPADIPRLFADVDAAFYEGKSQGPGSIVVSAQPPLTRTQVIPPARSPAA